MFEILPWWADYAGVLLFRSPPGIPDATRVICRYEAGRVRATLPTVGLSIFVLLFHPPTSVPRNLVVLALSGSSIMELCFPWQAVVDAIASPARA
jgi:hypothetical protein